SRPVLEKLVKRADVMIVNFPPPARLRLRLRWEDSQPINPRLVYCSLTGYGESGPDRDRPGFDVTAYFARSGILDAARYEGQTHTFSLAATGDAPTFLAAATGRPQHGDDHRLGDHDRPVPPRAHRQRRLGRHLALRQRRLVE